MTEATTEEVTRCMYGDGARAIHTLAVEGQGYLTVCTPCNNALHKKNKKKRCQYCGVPTGLGWNHPALPGFRHTERCRWDL